MVKIIITQNQSNQRLDRFLKKYFDKAPLSLIYRMIRKDVKVNGKRAKEDTILNSGDELTLYMTEEEAESLRGAREVKHVRRQFTIAYEDEHILIVGKPFGLLTHGDRHEKKNHLANQVIDYLIAEGSYDPSGDSTFSPAPANRIDRNTTGLVIFAKDAQTLRDLNSLLRDKSGIEKYYLTITNGRIPSELHLTDRMVKDGNTNRIRILRNEEDGTSEDTGARIMETIARPLLYGRYNGRDYTLTEAQILTGRTHQIRAQLANAGYPLYGDSKYGRRANDRGAQLLHSYRLRFTDIDSDSSIAYMSGKEIIQEPPGEFREIAERIFGASCLDKLG